MTSPGRLAKDRGKRWETAVAKLFGGVRKWAGPGTDVEVGTTIIECKSQQDDSGLKKLVGWIEQARGYGPDWVLAVSLGMRAQKLTFAVLPIEELVRLKRVDQEWGARALSGESDLRGAQGADGDAAGPEAGAG